MIFQVKQYYFLVFLTFLMFMVLSCHKEGMPEPNFDLQDSAVEESDTHSFKNDDFKTDELIGGSAGGAPVTADGGCGESVVGGDDGEDDDCGGGSVFDDGGDGGASSNAIPK
jgi:hypothetical protein